MKNKEYKKKFLCIILASATLIATIFYVGKNVKIKIDAQSATAFSVFEGKKEKNNNLIDISGKRIIGVTTTEDFSKENQYESGIKNKHTKQEIFIGDKSFSIEWENIDTEIRNGLYEIKGFLDKNTNTVKITNAIFLNEVSDIIKTEEVGDKKNLTLLSEIRKKVPRKRVAVFLVDYKNTATQPFYPSAIDNMMFGEGKFARYFQEASYGRQQITGNVYGWYTLPENNGGVCQAFPSDLGPFIAQNEQINLNNYGNIVIITLCDGSVANGFSNTGPQPYIINGTTYNKTVSWVNISADKWNQVSDQMVESMPGDHILTNLERILIHEFGHALGLGHANAISCEGVLPNVSCENIELGNYYDTMAYETVASHINAWAKNKLGWFSGNELRTITTSGVYEISDLANPNNTATKAYRIRPVASSNKTPIWIEYRGGYGFDNGIDTEAFAGILGAGEAPPYDISENSDGIFIYKEGFEDQVYGALNKKTADLLYLRGAPNLSNSNPYQVSLNPGQTFSEPRYGLTITTLFPNNPNTKRFQVLLNPNLSCQFLTPDLKAFSFNSLENVIPGTAITINIYTKNMDYLSCPNSNFEMDIDYSAFQPNGVGGSIPALLSNLAPDDERHITRSIWIPESTPAGTYELTIRMTNINSGIYTEEVLPITIQ